MKWFPSFGFQRRKRELQEEIGLKLAQPPARWLRVAACEETGAEFVWVYRVEAEGPFVLCPVEIEHGEWLAPTELVARIKARPEDFCMSFRLIWSRVTAHSGK